MSIFANRKSKPKASFLSHTKNISQRGTVFSIDANFQELLDQLKQIKIFGSKKVTKFKILFKDFFICNNLDYKRGMIIFQDVLQQL